MLAPKKETLNPIQKAIGHRVEPFGIPWYVLLIIIIVSVILFQFVKWWLGLGFLIGTCSLVRKIIKVEPHPIRAVGLWWSYGRHAFDAGNRSFHNWSREVTPWQLLFRNIAKHFSNRTTSKK